VNATTQFFVEFPKEIVADLFECLVIAFQYDESARSFRLVVDFPKEQSEVDREFLALEFLGVRGFRREYGSAVNMRRFETRYSIRSEQVLIVVQSAGVTPKEGGYFLELWFGPAFGGLSCLFEQVRGQRRLARVTESDGRFLYQDWQSGEAFEFEDPFGHEQSP
jgi:hypothetical protein